MVDLPNLSKPKEGDRYGFQLDMNNHTCELLYNGISLGVYCKDLPDEITPAMSNDRRDGTSSIRFVRGERREL